MSVRDDFRESVFRRDRHRCVICGAPAVDAHHIMERRLFDDGGYVLDNGASLCADHHLEAERTRISPEEIRRAARITRIVLPPHLEEDQRYDKWGNPVLGNGTRMRGELFDEPGVQKVLAEGGVLPLFTDYVKYHRTLHLPWSPGLGKGDKVLTSVAHFEGQEVVVTEKRDGENSTLYRAYSHARSLDSAHHPSRSWLKAFHATFAHDIPTNHRLAGENLYATHSIHYHELRSFFELFSIWNEANRCLSWDETEVWGRKKTGTATRKIVGTGAPGDAHREAAGRTAAWLGR